MSEQTCGTCGFQFLDDEEHGHYEQMGDCPPGEYHRSEYVCIARLRSALAEAKAALKAYGHGNRERTHWEGCYRDSAHHECTVAEVDRLLLAFAGAQRTAKREVEISSLLNRSLKQAEDRATAAERRAERAEAALDAVCVSGVGLSPGLEMPLDSIVISRDSYDMARAALRGEGSAE